MTRFLPVQETGECQLQKGAGRKREKMMSPIYTWSWRQTWGYRQRSVCRRHDFGNQSYGWSKIFDFNFIYIKVIVEAMRN